MFGVNEKKNKREWERKAESERVKDWAIYQCEGDFIEIAMRLIDVICEYIGIKVSNYFFLTILIIQEEKEMQRTKEEKLHFLSPSNFRRGKSCRHQKFDITEVNMPFKRRKSRRTKICGFWHLWISIVFAWRYRSKGGFYSHNRWWEGNHEAQKCRKLCAFHMEKVNNKKLLQEHQQQWKKTIAKTEKKSQKQILFSFKNKFQINWSLTHFIFCNNNNRKNNFAFFFVYR